MVIQSIPGYKVQCTGCRRKAAGGGNGLQHDERVWRQGLRSFLHDESIYVQTD
jgi:hypothetical protein